MYFLRTFDRKFKVHARQGTNQSHLDRLENTRGVGIRDIFIAVIIIKAGRWVTVRHIAINRKTDNFTKNERRQRRDKRSLIKKDVFQTVDYCLRFHCCCSCRYGRIHLADKFFVNNCNAPSFYNCVHCLRGQGFVPIIVNIFMHVLCGDGWIA